MMRLVGGGRDRGGGSRGGRGGGRDKRPVREERGRSGVASGRVDKRREGGTRDRGGGGAGARGTERPARGAGSGGIRASAGRGARSGEKKERKQREARYKEMQQKSKKFRGEMRKNKFHADQMREEADEELRGIRHLLHPMMMTREEQKSTKHPVLVKLDKEIEGWKVAERPTADVWKQQQDLKKNSEILDPKLEALRAGRKAVRQAEKDKRRADAAEERDR